MDFTFDAGAARNSERSGEYISESGAYVGVLLRAAEVTSQQGTQGIDLLFESNDKQRADYITLWHTKKDGTKLPGYDAINALMACIKTRSISARQMDAERWDKDAKKYIKTTVTGYPDLCNKPIGIVLQNTLSTNNKGADQKGKQIIGFFEASTRLTTREILDKTDKPQALDKQLAWLAQNPVRDTRASHSPATTSAPRNPGPLAGSNFCDFDGDIPF